MDTVIEAATLALYNRYRVRCGMPPVDSIGANKTPQVEAFRDDARAVLLAALAAVPVGDDVEERALLLEMDAETLDRAKLGGDNCIAAASLIRSLAASLAAVTAERDKARTAGVNDLATISRNLASAIAERDEAIRQREQALEALRRVCDQALHLLLGLECKADVTGASAVLSELITECATLAAIRKETAEHGVRGEPMPEWKRERLAFIKAYCDRSGIPEADRSETGFVLGGRRQYALPCDCGEPECQGWAMVSEESRETQLYRVGMGPMPLLKDSTDG
jgi:hypothetical protein